jgi:hypothetical protein
MKYLYLILVVFSLFLGCQKENDFNECSDVIYLENKELFNSITCFSVGNINAKSGIVIKDDIPYKLFADSMRIHPLNTSVDCDTATLIDIDFNKYSLIGISTGYGACDNIKRNIFRDIVNKKIIYNIDIKEHKGRCIDLYIFNLNLALIPKISDTYVVEFNVNRYK